MEQSTDYLYLRAESTEHGEWRVDDLLVVTTRSVYPAGTAVVSITTGAAADRDGIVERWVERVDPDGTVDRVVLK